MKSKIIPVILAGGSGTRLWPLSRKNFPKQFLALNSSDSLLQQTVKRAQLLTRDDLFIVTNDAHYFLCQEQLEVIAPATKYLLEPCPRNTAPAIASTAHYIQSKYGSDSILLILPSDHWINDDLQWQKVIESGLNYAQTHKTIVTFGITPDSPRTGYGYIEVDSENKTAPYPVLSFREKPDAETATQFLLKGNYFWNSGMFLCQTQLFLDEIQNFVPEIFNCSLNAVEQALEHHDFIRLDPTHFSACPEDSIDYAVMERSENTVMLPLSIGWSDLGDWSAVAETKEQDNQGNSLLGNIMVQDTQNCLITSDQTFVSTIGIKNQIIVATKDAILIADKQYTQQVKSLVNALSYENRQLADDPHRVMRPWGYFEVLAEGPHFKVKRLMVKPGGQLSLQRHQKRAEHWVVVQGKADVVNGEETLTLGTNQSTYIPANTLHRLGNTSSHPLLIIEVQTGNYLGEDDIERFDDRYQRALFEVSI